jgi:hypothetical protein
MKGDLVIQRPTEPGTLWIECPFCGRNVAVASGFTAMTISRLKVIEALTKLGWETLPVLKCDGCLKCGN